MPRRLPVLVLCSALGCGVAAAPPRADPAGPDAGAAPAPRLCYAAPALVTRDVFQEQIALEDVDGDGVLDLVGKDPSNAALRVWRGRGDGTFAPPIESASPSEMMLLAVGRIDADALPDVLLRGGNTPYALVVQPGRGDLTFGAPVELGGPGMQCGVEVGHLSQDGRLDVAGMGSGSPVTLEALASGPEGYTALRGTLPLLSFATAIADLDGDGQGEVLSAGAEDRVLRVHARRGAELVPIAQYPTGAGTRDIRTADLNRDGWLDVMVANNFDAEVPFGVYLGAGGGRLAPPRTALRFSGGGRLRLADLDRDGSVDALVMREQDARLRLYVNDGTGSFPVGVEVSGVPGLRDVAVGDVDRDGRPDLALLEANPGALVVVLARDPALCR